MVYLTLAPSFEAGVLGRCLHFLSRPLLWVSWALLSCSHSLAQQDARTQSHLALAAAYVQADMMAHGMSEADKVLALSPNLPEALALKAIIFQRQARLDLAAHFFQQSSQLAPNSPQIAHNWGFFECQQGRFESAFEKLAFAHAHSEGLERDKSLWIWGDCLRQNGQLTNANLKMSQALQRQPSFISEGLMLARLKIELGSHAEAEKILDLLNDSPSVSAQSLWLSVQLAQRQNQAVKKNHWGKMLGLLFSNSAQWRAYQEGASHD